MSTQATMTAERTATTPQPPAITLSSRPMLASLRHVATLTKRSLIKTWRTPEALVDVTLQPILMLVIFVYIFGGAISGSTHDYLQFLLPGILAQTIAMGAVAIGVNLNKDMETGIFDRFRSLPIARSAPLVAGVLGDVIRYVIVTVVTLATGYVMGFRIATTPWHAIAGCLLAVIFAVALSWLSVLIGMLVRTPGAVQGIMIMLIMPLSFASNVFVSADTLPGWMQGVIRVNPLTHLVGAMRGLFLGGPVASDVLWTLGWSAGLVAVLAPLAMRAYRRRV